MKIQHVFFLFFFVGWMACSPPPSIQEFNVQMEEAHRSLMEEERDLLEDYFTLQEFHDGMIFECKEQSQEPYDAMKDQFKALKTQKEIIQKSRGEFYAMNRGVIDSLNDVRDAPDKKTKKEFELRSADFRAKAMKTKSQFYQHKSSYDSLANAYGIERITHGDYADSLITRIISWEDSLEWQGSEIAGSLNKLKAKFENKRGDEYIKRYQYISQLQKLHKGLESHLTGLNNAHGRYDSSRQDEFYYMGPGMVERHDVNTTESLFDKLTDNMREFHFQLNQFSASL